MTSTDTIACRLAHWSASLEQGDVPAPVQHAAKRSIVDTSAVAVAGSRMPTARAIRRHVAHNYAGDHCTVLGADERASAVGAALANGFAAHVLDFDDTSYAGIVHGSTIVLPAVLAAAELKGRSGADLLTAFIIGSEVAYAVGLTATKSHYMKGWWASGTCGVVGGAAGAARLLGLGSERTAHAIAAASVQACGMVAVLGTDAKPLLAGRAAMVAVESALLARDGLTAPMAAFEDRRGFLALMNDGREDAEGLAGLGNVWRLVEPGILFKRYPVCSAVQAAGEMTERLIAEQSLSLEDIDEVLCEVTNLVAISLVYDRPKTPAEAQFSMPFAIGAILADGHLGPEHIAPERLADERLQGAMRKVVMREASDLDEPEIRERYPEGARVTITTKQGARHSGFLGAPMGMPETPMSDEALGKKFHDCARFAGWSEACAERVLTGLWSLETVGDITPLLGGERDGQ